MAKPILLTDDISGATGEDARRSRSVRAMAQALAVKLGAPVEMLHVEDLSFYPENRAAYRPFIESLLSKQEDRLEKLARSGNVRISARVAEGSPVERILRTASKPGSYELIALGTHGYRGLKRLLLGSVAEEVVRHSKVPVLVLGPKAQGARKPFASSGTPRIVVATDLGPNSRRAEAYALGLARRLRAEVVLVHTLFEGLHPVIQTAYSGPSGQKELRGMIAELGARALKALLRRAASFERSGVRCVPVLEDAPMPASAAICRAAAAHSASLVVMGTHGRNLLAGAFLGSTSRKVILGSPVPVITVRSRS